MIKQILSVIISGGVGYGLGDLAIKGQWWPLAIVVGLIAFDRMLDKKKLVVNAEIVGHKSGLALSMILVTKLGTKLADQIELRIIKLKSIADAFLSGFIIGMRADNISVGDAIDISTKQRNMNEDLIWDVEHLRKL